MERRSAAQRERGSCHRLGRSGAARGCDRRARLPPLIRRTTMAYQGSCRCGAVSYTVEGDIPDTAMSCNCSHCRRKGFLLTFVPIDQFRLESGADKPASYKFNKPNIDQQLCPHKTEKR